MDPIKYIFEKHALTGRVFRWQMVLTKYDIQYVTQKAIKGSVLSYYLAHQPVEDYQPMKFDFPDEDILFIREFNVPGPEEGPEPGSQWTLVFDGASNAHGHGIGAIITSPIGFHLPFIARLCFDCPSNMVEYEACIFSIEAVIDLRIKIIEVYRDSTLVISLVWGYWETRDHKLIPYKEHVMKLIPCFDEITFHHIPREKNQLADALDTLSSMFKVKWRNQAPSINIQHLDEPAYCLEIEEESDGKPWFYDIKRYVKKQGYPENVSIKDKKALRELESHFFVSGGVLYKRSYDSVLLRCMDRHEAEWIIIDVHKGSFGTHVGGDSMFKNILRAGYYWLTIEVDYFRHVQTCHKCQIYVDRIHVPQVPLNVISSPWPFAMWGINVIRRIEPTTSNGYRFILVAIYYFTKWVEVASYANVTK
ncbi:uncharacterized protein LOC127094662 [Lathyrus oleraceus]|uniref:uncharacterized protein LOC127094662 n=1 Tax=Pisum sativum TaxID=3888 RepID=UPI0021D0F40F|nr:uncharacterized protein LOC127094662 [Pisum sativum]